MTLHDLETLKNVDLKDIDRELVKDIDDIIIDQAKGKYERINDYLEMAHNPYFVKCGDLLIKMSFTDTDIKIDECIERYLIECLNDRL